MVSVSHGGRQVDFSQGEQLGPQDHIIEWKRSPRRHAKHLSTAEPSHDASALGFGWSCTEREAYSRVCGLGGQPVRRHSLYRGKDAAALREWNRGAGPGWRRVWRQPVSGQAHWRFDGDGQRHAAAIDQRRASLRVCRDRSGFSQFFSPPSGTLVIAPSMLCHFQSMPFRSSYSVKASSRAPRAAQFHPFLEIRMDRMPEPNCLGIAFH